MPRTPPLMREAERNSATVKRMAFPRAAHDLKFIHGRLLDLTFFRGNDHVVTTYPFGDIDNRGYTFALLDGDQVNDMLTPGCTAHIRQIVDFELEDTPPVGKEQQTVMRMCNQQMTYSVIFACLHARYATSTSALGAVGAGRQALDVAFLGQRHNDFFVGDKVFFPELT